MGNRTSKRCETRFARVLGGLIGILLAAGPLAGSWLFAQQPPVTQSDPTADSLGETFREQIQPLLETYCVRCHNADKRESGIRIDDLSGDVEDRQLRLWQGVQHQLADKAMPPDDQPQPSAEQRELLGQWIDQALLHARSRPRDKNGSVRRLTVAQYRNTLHDLLGLEDELADILPPDAVSKDGFVNNEQTMLLSPLLLEAYLEIAARALERCLVDESTLPVIQNVRMDLGESINADPFPEALILGANSHLLANDDFVVTQPTPDKPFDFVPFGMQTKFRYIEGYQGNDTVRGWRDYDSIYHAVFACMRGTEGYPKGKAYETVPEGLLLRPAIPSAELFEVESTYGPRANFKVSLRQLPDQGRFRVTVKAAKYDDGLLLDPGTPPMATLSQGALSVEALHQPQTIEVEQAGVYQVDVPMTYELDPATKPDESRLHEGLIGAWLLDGDAAGGTQENQYAGQLLGGARFVDSPFGQSLALDGTTGSVLVQRDDSLAVGAGEFTVAAWIHPSELRQAGIVSLGGYGYTHGWVFDMPGNNGVLRLETAKPGNQSNGTIQSRPGVIRANQWQHVAAVVRRGENAARLYVNGHQIAVGTILPEDLDNPAVDLQIGRVPNANLFAGQIDEVRLYHRALDEAEIRALVVPGQSLVQPLPVQCAPAAAAATR